MEKNLVILLYFFFLKSYILPFEIVLLHRQHRLLLNNDCIMSPSYIIEASDMFMKADVWLTVIVGKLISISHKQKAWIGVVEDY